MNAVPPTCFDTPEDTYIDLRDSDKWIEITGR